MSAGRPKIFKSPDELYQHFRDYKKQVKNNPRMVHDYVGKDGISVYREREVPLTMDGFECYLYEKDIISDLGLYIANKDGAYDDFLTICNRIRKEIRNDQIEGGMTGVYNTSITQRLNGLVDRVDQTSNGEKIDQSISVNIVAPNED